MTFVFDSLVRLHAFVFLSLRQNPMNTINNELRLIIIGPFRAITCSFKIQINHVLVPLEANSSNKQTD